MSAAAILQVFGVALMSLTVGGVVLFVFVIMWRDREWGDLLLFGLLFGSVILGAILVVLGSLMQGGP